MKTTTAIPSTENLFLVGYQVTDFKLCYMCSNDGPTVSNMRDHIVPNLLKERNELALLNHHEFTETIEAIDKAVAHFESRFS